jgi:DNA helicase II / ATP-dependent DNA helicase PcrA
MEIETEGAVYINMSNILGGLNESQIQAVTATVRHLLVVAGPGTGKTLTVVRRIAHLIEHGVLPNQIVAVTFTNRAAREMRERIDALLGTQASGMFIGTFHLLGLRIMKESLDEQFTVCARDDQIDVLRPIAGSQAKAQVSAETISRVKNRAEQPDVETKDVYEAYEMALRQKGLYDFDDLIRVPTELFETGRVAASFRDRFKHIIVDEYQDISPAQYRLLRCLATRDQSTLSAVGDSDQAIYAFRGADVENFLNFRNDFADAAMVVLKENYRSTRVVLGAAEVLIRSNVRRIGRELSARRDEGERIRILSVPDQRTEAEIVVREIEDRVGGTSHYRLAGEKAARDFGETSYAFSDFAVLFRTNAQAKVLREAFEACGIPCQVVGERHPLNKKSLTEKLRAEIHDTAEPLDVFSLLKDAAGEAGASAADVSLLEAVAAPYRHLPTRDAVREIINELSLLSMADAFDPRADAVALMTLHMAKGLEFKVVFIAGCDEGLIPFALIRDDADIEEERRLFYVGMTRAKDELLLLCARNRFLYGQSLSGNPSPFLAEIPEELVRMESVADKPRKQQKAKQPTLF